mmetsp:Transcript_44960/g.43535  ORF Transcript_44960/g.43535 Transcript_44960/m.43535 type:complete len:109 (+) Transcript_44960:219-545(+)
MAGFLFFYSYFFLAVLIFLNLFVAIILDGYSETQNKESRTFNNDCLNHFLTIWSDFDPEATGFIKIAKFHEFLTVLGDPLGFEPVFARINFLKKRFVLNLYLPNYNEQ